ncbi:MAG TPA: metalloregulator ArsR/SmtB family transcription factor [Bacillales bacterium]|nr:metalloregulator ArsR/SmtB family transcription factor [Bacillales bacterium]
MEILNTTSRERETYRVRIKYSLLWECALGIAAVTNSRLIDTLKKPMDFWEETRQSLSKELLAELDHVEKNNTWKALLQLLHQQDFADLSTFTVYIKNLSEQELRFICIPFIGSKHQETRKNAAEGNQKAVNELKEITKNNPFFPAYIEFVCKTNHKDLKNHLLAVMKGWYEEYVEPEADKLFKYLDKDYETKMEMNEKMKPEEMVEWATGGITYLPEPNVHEVILIPQYIYRPWNIEADVEGAKVYYYPIANESIHPDDPYSPNYFLVQKHKALGDEVRLRIVKLLSKHDRTLQEITNVMDMGKSTLHHHLKILRSARLVEVQNAKYHLKKNAVASLSKELNQYLGGS